MSDKDCIHEALLSDSVIIQNEQEDSTSNSSKFKVGIHSSNSSQVPENNRPDFAYENASNHFSERSELFCIECKTAYKTARTFEVHQQWHSVPRPFKCGKCEATFQHNDALLTHMQWHTNDRPFVCGVCNMTFKTAWSCEVHKKKHMKRGYKCSICGDKFSKKMELRNHERRHTDYPYECDVCDALFMVRYYLKVHMRKHTNKRPWKCWECKAIFVERTSLDCHKEKEHPLYTTD